MTAQPGHTAFQPIFKRDTKGQSTVPVTVDVERGRIRFLAETLGFDDPIHHSLDAARAAGHPDLVAPPSFYMVIEAAADAERRRRGEPSSAEMVGCDFRYLLHGDERYDFSGPIYAGTEVTIRTTVLDFYEKKGGALEFVTFESVVTDPTRGTLISATRTLVHRLG